MWRLQFNTNVISIRSADQCSIKQEFRVKSRNFDFNLKTLKKAFNVKAVIDQLVYKGLKKRDTNHLWKTIPKLPGKKIPLYGAIEREKNGMF